MRPTIEKFAWAMEKKLRRDDSVKKPWEQQGILDLFVALKVEVDELEEALCDGDNADIALEAADVANFAMMIWAAVHPVYSKYERGYLHGSVEEKPQYDIDY